MGLIDEVLHSRRRAYREQREARGHGRGARLARRPPRPGGVDAALRALRRRLPAARRLHRESPLDDYLAGETAGVPHRQVALEELMMLWLANVNPAFAPFRELFDDAALAAATAYPGIMAAPARLLRRPSPRSAPTSRTWWTCCAPRPWPSPDSLAGQLEFIRERWAAAGRPFCALLSGLDVTQGGASCAAWPALPPAGPGRRAAASPPSAGEGSGAGRRVRGASAVPRRSSPSTSASAATSTGCRAWC